MKMPALLFYQVCKHLHPICQSYSLGHPIIRGIGEQHLVASVDIAEQDIEHCFPSAAGDEHLALWVIVEAQVGLVAGSNRVPQFGQPMKWQIAIIPIHAYGISSSLHGLRWRWQIGIGIFEPNAIRLLVREVSHICHRHTNQTGASVRKKKRHSILSFLLDGVITECWADPGHFRSWL